MKKNKQGRSDRQFDLSSLNGKTLTALKNILAQQPNVYDGGGTSSQSWDKNQPYDDKLTLMTWNLNGWNGKDNEDKHYCIKLLNLDICCLTETHLSSDEKIGLDGFNWPTGF